MSSVNRIQEKRDAFVESAKQANPILQAEGVSLDFTGYNIMLNEYVTCHEYDISALDNCAKDLDAWIVYFMELEAFLTFLCTRFENKRAYLDSFPVQPQIERELTQVYRQLRATSLFRQHLRIQIKLFKRFYYHTTMQLREAHEHMNYRPYQEEAL